MQLDVYDELAAEDQLNLGSTETLTTTTPSTGGLEYWGCGREGVSGCGEEEQVCSGT